MYVLPVPRSGPFLRLAETLWCGTVEPQATLGQPLHGPNRLGPAGEKSRTLVV